MAFCQMVQESAPCQLQALHHYFGDALEDFVAKIVIGFALLSYFQYDTLIVAWLTGFYPNGQIGL